MAQFRLVAAYRKAKRTGVFFRSAMLATTPGKLLMLSSWVLVAAKAYEVISKAYDKGVLKVFKIPFKGLLNAF